MKNGPLGHLYVIATPIGNLEDMTLRALRILQEVSVIACEDTRHTRKLLNHYKIHATAVSYHDYNKEEKAPVLVQRLREGNSIALVADAGTPGISDPGYYLINCCIQSGLPIIPVPGPSAFLAALSVSGLPTDSFAFEGFLPRKKTARQKRLIALREDPRTLILYESPHRLLPCLSDLLEVFGDRRVAVSRELTKSYEETARGRLSKLISKYSDQKVRGEVTMVIEGNRKFPPLWE